MEVRWEVHDNTEGVQNMRPENMEYNEKYNEYVFVRRLRHSPETFEGKGGRNGRVRWEVHCDTEGVKIIDYEIIVKNEEYFDCLSVFFTFLGHLKERKEGI